MSMFGSVRGGYDDRDQYGKYYPGTYIDEHPRYTRERGEGRAYRTYRGNKGPDGFDYVMTSEPFKPDSDYYMKEHKKPYYYKDNRLYHSKDPVRKHYDGSGNVTVTVIDGGTVSGKAALADYQRYTTGSSISSSRRRSEDAQSQIHESHPQIKKEEVEVGYMVEHLASFDIGEDCEPGQTSENIEAAIESLRNMNQDNAILPLRCYLTYKEEEIQVLSDKELTVLEWIKLDDVNLVSAEVHQITRYEQILLIQVKEVIHLFCPVGDLSADDLARNIKERISKRRDRVDEETRSNPGTKWQEDSSNNRFLLNDETIKKENDADFYDKYTMQLYGRATRDYVARNDKELTVMSGERVEIQSTSGKWWLARTSNSKSGYCPAEVLESYVTSPAGLPRSTLPGEKRRDADTVSERGSVYSSASRQQESGRDYHDRKRNERYDQRDHRDERRDGCRDSSRYDGNINASHSVFGTQRGFPTGLGVGGNTNFGTGFNNGLGTAGLAAPLAGNGFGTVGPAAGFSTVSSATSAGLFPNGFTQTLRGNIPLAQTGLGGATFGAQGLGGATLGMQGLGGATLGAQGLGGATLGAQGLFANPASLGLPPVGTSRLAGVRPVGTFARNVPIGTQLSGLGGAQFGGAQLGGAQLGGAQLGGAQLGGAQFGSAQLGGAQLGSAQLGGQLGGAQLGGLGGAGYRFM